MGVLQVQDTIGCEEDMLELDSNVQVHTGNIREKVRKTCKRIQDLRFDQITSAIPSHRYDEWRGALNLLEKITIACYNNVPQTSTVPATSSSDVVASTSGLNIAAAAAAASSSTTATTTTSTGNHNDEVNTSIVNDDEFGT